MPMDRVLSLRNTITAVSNLLRQMIWISKVRTYPMSAVLRLLSK